MCGIVGILGREPVTDTLIECLKRLEYRGYDSAGIATLYEGALQRYRSEGKIVNLQARVQESNAKGVVGIGHTRWATHGVPSERNAHPHATPKVAVVHNGIIENFAELRAMLEKKGHTFTSDTDTEVIAHLVTDHLDAGLTPQDAASKALKVFHGAFALAMIFEGHGNLMICARRGSPWPLALGMMPCFWVQTLWRSRR